MTGDIGHEFQNAIASPVEHWKFGYTKHGLYEENGQKIKKWPILTSADSRFPIMPKSPPNPEATLPGNWLYGGFFDHRFGHFLTETVPNLLAVKRDLVRYEDVRILMHSWPDIYQEHPDLQTGIWPEIDYFLDRIGLPRNLFRFIDKPLTAERLVIGEAPFDGKFSYTESLKPLVNESFRTKQDTKSNLYLSRTKWPHKPRVANELEIESAFAAKGFEIVHLQNHALADQIDIIAGANGIAGPQGTALHWSLFAPNIRFVLSLGGKSKLQAEICKFHNQSYREVVGNRVKWNYGRYRHVPVQHCLNALTDLI